jgi:hypothetical protein
MAMLLIPLMNLRKLVHTVKGDHLIMLSPSCCRLNMLKVDEGIVIAFNVDIF